MTAKFPASIATNADLGQPNASDMLDSPDHASLHRQITDEIIAIETALGVGLANAGGVTGFANLAAFPATGVVNKVYLALDTGKMYRWDAPTTAYVAIGGGGTVAGALHYDGAKDVTSALGTYVPTQGATVTASAAGAVNASWPGAAGQTVSIGDVLMFDGTNWHVQAGMADVNLMVRKTDVLAGAGLHDLTAALSGITPVANMVVKASKSGTAHASWAGITGTVKAGAVYQYNGTAWVVVDQTKVPSAGASNLMYVNVAGDTMYGELVISVGTAGLSKYPVVASFQGMDIRAWSGGPGSGSFAIGTGAGKNITLSTGMIHSVLMGEDVCANATKTGSSVVIGSQAALGRTDVESSVIIGHKAGSGSAAASNIIAIGDNSNPPGNGINIGANTSTISIAVGNLVGEKALPASSNSIGIGVGAFRNSGSTGYSVGIGQDACQYLNAPNSVGIGVYAMRYSPLYNGCVVIGAPFQSSAPVNSSVSILGGALGADSQTYIGYLSGVSDIDNIASANYLSASQLTLATPTKFPVGSFVSLTCATSTIPNISPMGIHYPFKVISQTVIEIGVSGITLASGTLSAVSLSLNNPYQNSTAIGAYSKPSKANQVVLGDDNVTEVKTHGLYVGTVGGVSQRMVGLQELKTIVAAANSYHDFQIAIAALT